MGWKTLVVMLVGIAVLIIMVLGVDYFSRPVATSATLSEKLIRIDQNPSHYVLGNQSMITISPDQQAQLTRTFLDLYFLPWDDEAHAVVSNMKALAMTQQDQRDFLREPGWRFTGETFSTEDIRALVANADLTDYPRINRPGMVVNVTEARLLPTLLPAYGDPSQAGEGYPFDKFISAYIFPGMPARILQQSKDGLWYFVKMASYYGWAPTKDIGFVSPAAMAEWRKYPFVVALWDGVPIYSAQKRVENYLRKGILYPVTGEEGQQFKILIPFLDASGNVQLQTLLVNKADSRSFPLPATVQEIAAFAQSFMGAPYGWGNLYELRDCSATTEDILAPFGLWLPRNSNRQGRVGKVISMAQMSSAEKVNIFSQQAIPFFTIVNFPGHVALYIGIRNNQVYVLQDMWGLHTRNLLGQTGRAIIGKTVITPLDFGKGFRNIDKIQLQSVESISILSPNAYSDPQAIRQQVW